MPDKKKELIQQNVSLAQFVRDCDKQFQELRGSIRNADKKAEMAMAMIGVGSTIDAMPWYRPGKREARQAHAILTRGIALNMAPEALTQFIETIPQSALSPRGQKNVERVFAHAYCAIQAGDPMADLERRKIEVPGADDKKVAVEATAETPRRKWYLRLAAFWRKSGGELVPKPEPEPVPAS